MYIFSFSLHKAEQMLVKGMPKYSFFEPVYNLYFKGLISKEDFVLAQILSETSPFFPPALTTVRKINKMLPIFGTSVTYCEISVGMQFPAFLFFSCFLRSPPTIHG